ncbi:tetratricopeptide repeat protein [Kitasatospora sp. NPDC096128]|uniref:tetratricopeptide repeat protein n=1 Tax=Kitasatospora sp. NPDC096128 TaxID=3155547 RepID=UPI00331A67A2
MGFVRKWRARKAWDLHQDALRLLNLGRARDAEPLIGKAVDIRSAALGSDAADTLESRVVRANVLHRLQRGEEAETEGREVLRLAGGEAVQPGIVCRARLLIGRVCLATGRAEEARTEAAAALELAGRYHDEPIRHSVRMFHARVLNVLGRHVEAATELGAIAADEAAGSGPRSIGALNARSDRAQILVYLGRYEEAEEECRALIDIAPATQHRVPLGLAVLNALVLALAMGGRAVEAEAEARTAVEFAESAKGMDARFVLTARLGLARALNAQDRYDEALSLLGPSNDFLPGDLGTEEELAAALRLVTATALLGLGQDAGGTVREAVAVCGRILGPYHHRALEAGTLHGRVLAAQGRTADALERLAANAADWREHFGDGHPGTRAAQEALSHVSSAS